MGLIHEEMALSYQESTIHRWEHERYITQWSALGLVGAALIATFLADGRTVRLFIWGVCLAAVVFLALLDIRYADMITKGKEQYFNAAVESLRTRRKLEEMGYYSYDSREEQQRLFRDMPTGKESFALAWFLIIFGVCLAFFLWFLLK